MTWNTIQKDTDMYTFEENKPFEAVYFNRELNKGTKQNSTIHHFKLDDGTEVKAWGSTVLDDRLNDIFELTGFPVRVRITYLGKRQTKSGGSTYKDFNVEYEDTKESSEPAKIDDKSLPF